MKNINRVLFALSIMLMTSSFAFAAKQSRVLAEKSDEELARELANPNTPLASLKFKVQYRNYIGDFPDADKQSGTTVVLQPTLPFPLKSGRTLWVRPAVPFVLDQPSFDVNNTLWRD